MEIVNFLRQPAQIESVHGGEGLCRNCRVLGPESFDTPVRFLYYTVLPSGASFGEHTHGDDNEVYLVLEGSGLYSMNGEAAPVEAGDVLNSVYTRSGQNSTPNSNATNLHSSQKRCCSFCISSSNASPTFQVQKSIFHQMTKPIQVTVILPLLLAISFSRNDDIHSSISGISNDLIGVIPTIGQ